MNAYLIDADGSVFQIADPIRLVNQLPSSVKPVGSATFDDIRQRLGHDHVTRHMTTHLEMWMIEDSICTPNPIAAQLTGDRDIRGPVIVRCDPDWSLNHAGELVEGSMLLQSERPAFVPTGSGPPTLRVIDGGKK